MNIYVYKHIRCGQNSGKGSGQGSLSVSNMLLIYVIEYVNDCTPNMHPIYVSRYYVYTYGCVIFVVLLIFYINIFFLLFNYNIFIFISSDYFLLVILLIYN